MNDVSTTSALPISFSNSAIPRSSFKFSVIPSLFRFAMLCSADLSQGRGASGSLSL